MKRKVTGFEVLSSAVSDLSASFIHRYSSQRALRLAWAIPMEPAQVAPFKTCPHAKVFCNLMDGQDELTGDTSLPE